MSFYCSIAYRLYLQRPCPKSPGQMCNRGAASCCKPKLKMCALQQIASLWVGFYNPSRKMECMWWHPQTSSSCQWTQLGTDKDTPWRPGQGSACLELNNWSSSDELLRQCMKKPLFRATVDALWCPGHLAVAAPSVTHVHIAGCVHIAALQPIIKPVTIAALC